MRLHFSTFLELSMISFLKKKNTFLRKKKYNLFWFFLLSFWSLDFHTSSLPLFEAQCPHMNSKDSADTCHSFRSVALSLSWRTNPYLQVINVSHRSGLHVTEKQEHKAVKRLENHLPNSNFTLHLIPL